MEGLVAHEWGEDEWAKGEEKNYQHACGLSAFTGPINREYKYQAIDE